MAPQTPVKHDFGAWIPLFSQYGISTLAHDLLLRGTLRDDLDPGSEELLAVVRAWPFPVHVHGGEGATEVVAVLPTSEPPARLWVHGLLLAATVLTTLGAGSLLGGFDPFRTRMTDVLGVELPYPTALHLPTLLRGVTFALPFLGVLLAHEMGHWAAARRHRIRASLPFFLPVPPYLSLIGTLGAFIRLRGPTIRRDHLFDVGAAGPLASFVLSVPLLAVGLSMSRAVPGWAGAMTPYVVEFAGAPVWLGQGLMTHALAAVLAPESGSGPLLLHPVALAGWMGLFVTALNLLPLGQLDGGHILYSLLGRRQARFGRLFLMALLPLGLLWWGWWLWAAVILVLHRGRSTHPRVVQPDPPITGTRRFLGYALVIVFFLTFVPVPLRL